MREWLILHTAAVAVLAGVAALLGRRLGPAGRHVLWLVVLLKLLTPPVLFWPFVLPALFEAETDLHGTAAGRPVTAKDPTAGPVEAGGGPVVVVELPADEAPTVLAEGRTTPLAINPEPEAAAVTWEEWLWQGAQLVWIAGGLFVAVVQGIRIVGLWRRLCQGRPAPSGLTAEVATAAAELGVRPPEIRVLAGLASPMLCGWGSPRLLWPDGLEQELASDGRRAVLIHELAHLRRRDHWTAWLLLLGACAWWWHPLYWFIRGRLTREAELACDAWVVATMPHGRRAYAEALLAIALRGSWMAAPGPALGAASSRRDLERRLIMIMRERPVCRLSFPIAAAAVALALLGLPAWTLQSLGQQPAPTLTPADPIAPAQPLVTPQKATAPTPVQYPIPTQVPDPEAASRNKKIQYLEQKIHALMKELRDLRGDMQPPPVALAAPPLDHQGQQQFYYEPVTTFRDGKTVTTYQIRTTLVGQSAAANEVTLSRVAYKLPAGKALALSTFLDEQVKAVVLETKVDGETITVTTTPETQRAIGQFVTLLRAKAAKSDTSTSVPQ